jgi:hypothetical protein
LDISPSQIITYSSIFVGIAGGWFGIKFGLDRANEKITENQRQIDALWKWKDEHEKDATRNREEFHSEISQLKGAHLVADQILKQIVQLLEEIKQRIGVLEKK